MLLTYETKCGHFVELRRIRFRITSGLDRCLAWWDKKLSN